MNDEDDEFDWMWRKMMTITLVILCAIVFGPLIWEFMQ